MDLPKSESCGLLRLMGSKVRATESRDPVVALFIFFLKFKPCSMIYELYGVLSDKGYLVYSILIETSIKYLYGGSSRDI